MTSDDARPDEGMAITSQAATAMDLAQNTALPNFSPNSSTPRKNKRRTNADPEDAYTLSKRASTSKPAHSSNPRRRNRSSIGLSQSYAFKLDDSEDEDYKVPGKSARTKQPRRRGTRTSARRNTEAEGDSDGGPFIYGPDSEKRMCAMNCDRWDEEEMLTCAGNACQEVERKFHIQCVGFRNMPPMLRDGGEGVKWYCFDCRMENGVGSKMNGIVVEVGEGEDQ
ncbi:hypothetical protein HII31_01763 [Pseudocercospora fuligena]|uniref:PHD-type domain-containing protein n=1 Tax=Pseudocercospora fuligena TaxID=685502 RepID=A0A8H6RRZ4_9PEZI|nr:hypothetical protein HII31_01763 [Pseudocercospora fuligena]